MENKKWMLGLVVGLWAALSAMAAPPPPIKMTHTVELQAFSGKATFLEAMLEKNTGLVAHMDASYTDSYKIPSWKAVNDAIKHFDTKVPRKALKPLTPSTKEEKDRNKAAQIAKDELKRIVTELKSEETFSPNDFSGVVGGKMKRNAKPFDIANFVGMAAGAGTLVKIDDDNYYYNYGYEAGNVRSGRSYGASHNHRANDATDIFYLQELAKFLGNAEERDISLFYETLIKVLTNCDVSGFEKLPLDGQTVATDFVAVYTAESYRHIIEDLNPKKYPWDNDLAEATFVMNYNSTVNKIMKDGELVDVDPKTGRPLTEEEITENEDDTEAKEPEYVWWWKNNPETGRSGIGKTNRDRRTMTAAVSAFEREHHADLVDPIEKIIGESPNGDVYQGLMEYLNNPIFLTSSEGQKEIRKSSGPLSKAMAKFLMQTREDAEEITKHIEDKE